MKPILKTYKVMECFFLPSLGSVIEGKDGRWLLPELFHNSIKVSPGDTITIIEEEKRRGEYIDNETRQQHHASFAQIKISSKEKPSEGKMLIVPNNFLFDKIKNGALKD